MKRTVLVLSILMVGLLSLSACSTTISNKRLEEDILSIKEFALVKNIKDMSIINRNENNSSLEYKLNTSLESYNFDASADITLNYTKKDGLWTLSDHQLDITSISAKNDPPVNVAVTQVIGEVSSGLIDHPRLIGVKQTYTLISSTGTKESGAMSLVIGEIFEDEYMSIDVKYMVDAVYEYQTGWNFTLKDWVYTENMKWAGTYDLTWSKYTSQHPGQSTNLFFAIGNQIQDIKITGDLSRIKRMDKSQTISNTLRVQYRFKGKDFDLVPIVKSGISKLTPRRLAPPYHSLPPILHITINTSVSGYSKAP